MFVLLVDVGKEDVEYVDFWVCSQCGFGIFVGVGEILFVLVVFCDVLVLLFQD